jgi:taurine--2-oxoglutarate transaminase
LKDSIAQLERLIAYEGRAILLLFYWKDNQVLPGCFLYPDGYLKAVREICNRHGILLIMDEVMSGFGRTGKWFGFQHHDIVPDMIAMAKGLTCGYLPLVV